MGDWFQETALSGSILLALPVALIAGLVSFFSPCVIPLLPGYLSYASGISGADLAGGEVSRTARSRLLLGAVLFVLGFSVVFVILGMVAGGVGTWFLGHQRELNMVLGVVMVLLGITFMGAFSFLQRDWGRIHSVPSVGLAAAPVLGFLFGVGWMPCTGPTLAAINLLAMSEGTASRGALLSGVYALGLGLPFIVAALAYRRAMSAFAAVRRHQKWVMRVGGLMMIGVGLLLLTGWWAVLVQWLQLQLVDGVWLAV